MMFVNEGLCPQGKLLLMKPLQTNLSKKREKFISYAPVSIEVHNPL